LENLISTGHFETGIFDDKTGIIYPINEAGKQLDDGTILLLPKEDNVSNRDRVPGRIKTLDRELEYRFYYIAGQKMQIAE
jgi:hypothetical protein